MNVGVRHFLDLIDIPLGALPHGAPRLDHPAQFDRCFNAIAR